MAQNFDIKDEVITTLRRIIRAIDLHSRKLKKEHGLTGPQLLILKQLSLSPEMTVTDLAKKIHLSQSTVTNILDRMEYKGFIEKNRSETDKRRVNARISEYGAQIIESHPSLLQEEFLNRFEKLALWEQTALLSSLQRIASMMDAQTIDAQPFLATGSLVDSSESSIESAENDG